MLARGRKRMLRMAETRTISVRPGSNIGYLLRRYSLRNPSIPVWTASQDEDLII